MPTVERMKPISLFVPFEPIERRSKDEPLIVSGYCFANETVEGEGGIILERAAMQAATPEYMSRRTIREMHLPLAAGVAESVDWQEDGRCHLTARIVDPVARMKCEEGVYRGFSVKIRPTQRMGNRIKAVKWAENSLVDDPADPGCDNLLIHRADGFDPEQEVEVEVLDPEPSPSQPDSISLSPQGADSPVASAGPETVTPPAPDLVPSPDAAPLATDQPAAESEGTPLPPTEEQRAAIVEALRAQGLPEELVTRVQVVQVEPAVPNTWTAGGIGDGMEATQITITPTDTQRAISTATPALPLRESMEREELTLVQGSPPSESAQSAAELDALRRAVSTATPNLPVRENLEGKKREDAEIERYIKHEGGKWCVYSESGKKLGEHDTEAEAKAQLAAIEANKHERAAVLSEERYQELLAIVRAGSLSGITPEEAPPFFARLKEEVIAEATARIPANPPADVEPPAPSAPDTVSSPEGGEVLQRLQTAEAEVTRLRTAHEDALTRLATADATIARQKVLLDQPRDLPPARFAIHSLAREFTANLGSEGEARIARLRKEYDEAAAEAAAEREGDRNKRDRALERMIQRASELAEHGIYLKP